jgi:hypothetical protein
MCLHIVEIIASIASKLLEAFLLNYFFVFLYIIIIVIIRAQYEKYTELQGEIYGQPAKGLREITEEIILVGLVTGFVCSFAIISSGITIDTDSVKFLFYIMCLLLLINIRFMCINYAVGILAAVSLIFNYPKVDIPSVLALAAILHMIESILIYLNKGKDSIPVFIKHKDGIAGAYLIRKFWLIPVVFLTFMVQNSISSLPAGLINWNMLFRPDVLQKGSYALGLDCLVAVLCYSDLAITKHPERKSRETAIQLFTYSVLLFAIAAVSIRIQWLRYLGIVFCVVVHEGITAYGKFIEKKGTPLFSQVRRGLKVMDVMSGSHAQRMGIQRGDIILGINGRDVQTDDGINEALREYPTYTWIQAISWDGREKLYEYRCYPGGYNALGIISVPREKEVTYNTNDFENLSILKNIVSRFKGMNKSV